MRYLYAKVRFIVDTMFFFLLLLLLLTTATFTSRLIEILMGFR